MFLLCKITLNKNRLQSFSFNLFLIKKNTFWCKRLLSFSWFSTKWFGKLLKRFQPKDINQGTYILTELKLSRNSTIWFHLSFYLIESRSSYWRRQFDRILCILREQFECCWWFSGFCLPNCRYPYSFASFSRYSQLGYCCFTVKWGEIIS